MPAARASAPARPPWAAMSPWAAALRAASPRLPLPANGSVTKAARSELVTMRNRRALLTALAVDNFGSGLFLPLSLLYVTRVVRLPLATAGTVVALAGLAVPPAAGRLVDRAGPRPVVICAQLLQALGAVAYLAARGAAAVAVAAVLLAMGQQTFYSSLFALVSDVTGDGPKDRPFAVAAMVRSACFGLGGLAAAGLLSMAGPAAYRI